MTTGYEPDEDDKRLQLAYIEGTAILDDLLKHASECACKAQARDND